ncbi:protein-glutamine gamma-glutamyltransferase 2-like isoform X2 [Stegostoma tigrinum]|uniref:protein-glutamine gamma-glutamyltransferase 2-like isoform X2 n=1 Tax=Stegostoma tigrinum TaxID=3053191 RepID=UPI00202AF44E|nr:protein-glutamine gamma-glutamyltransferase 2-like isoform X2 [Stegostoma tigrinum]
MANSADRVMQDVSYVDLHCEKNNQDHRTAEISTKRLIVRRGQPFKITVQFNRNQYDPDNDRFKLVAQTGTNPSETSGTKILFLPSDTINAKRWSAVVVSSSRISLSLIISAAPNAKIGCHTIALQKVTVDQTLVYPLGEFVVLFNPWCSEDEVFMNDAAQLNEYVLNEQGIIFTGCSEYIQHLPWNFGQFEEDILDICLKLLDNSHKHLKNPAKDCARRSSPVYICRIVSAMINCNDDNGILFGKWDDPYTDGVHPGKWNGSVAILRQWNHSGCQPVCYGQCWVFAAVACTVLRCLGIPTRVVTNFESAHDTNGNLIIENEYDEEGMELGKSEDSIWNFHVWAESWMARYDLRPGNDGWQALDPTPQEKSEGVFCCGPAPVKAIKEGETDICYDVPFIFAEVNADCETWVYSKKGKKMKIDSNTRLVGQYISTKCVGSDDREDITANYKYPEGSEEERRIFQLAEKRRVPLKPENKLQLSLKTNDPVYNGTTVKVSAVISNKNSTKRICTFKINAMKKKYNRSSRGECIKKYQQEIYVAGHKDKTVEMEMSYQEYGELLDKYNLIRLTALVFDAETNESAFVLKDIALFNPNISIQVRDVPVLSQKVIIVISFENILPVDLTNGVFTLEGAGLIEGQMEVWLGTINPGEVITKEISIIPKKMGLKKLTVDFDSDNLKDVKGYANIDVRDGEK